MSDRPDKPGGEGFLSRWSRRKTEARAAQAADADFPDSEHQNTSTDAPSGAKVPENPRQTGTLPAASQAPQPLPPLETLTPDADFTPFMAKGVEADTRNAALKALFTDPHFNTMDGLDVYIEDFTQHTPIPMDMLRSLKQAQMLFADEKTDAKNAAAGSSVADPVEAKMGSARANEGLPALGPDTDAPTLESPQGVSEGSGVQVESALPIARQSVKNNP